MALQIGPDVAGEILSYMLQDPEIMCGVDCLSNMYPLWVFTHVTSSWRDAALSAPWVWTTVTVDMNRHTSHAAMAQRLSHFLFRSGDRKIQVVVTCNQLIDPQIIFQPLLDSSTRWQTADITVMSETLLKIHDGLPLHLPVLESLRLQLHWDEPSLILRVMNPSYVPLKEPGQDGEAFRKSELFRDASALRAFYTGRAYGVDRYVTIPWGQITGAHQKVSLGFAYDFPFRPVHLLEKCTAVKEASFIVDEWANRRAYPLSNVVTNTSLRSLKLRGCGTSMQVVLSHLDLPALEVLHLHVRDGEDPEDEICRGCPTINLEPLLGGAGLSLREFMVTLAATDWANMHALRFFLDETPNLTSIEIRFSMYGSIDEMCRMLYVGRGGWLGWRLWS
ncbi:hypothetical protein BDZ89DRAFT_120012 [Hymenopellis radicata]|nr:hypothetical protein BDZ89DRAFT_120012 [Hymenopellis radicata]